MKPGCSKIYLSSINEFKFLDFILIYLWSMLHQYAYITFVYIVCMCLLHMCHGSLNAIKNVKKINNIILNNLSISHQPVTFYQFKTIHSYPTMQCWKICLLVCRRLYIYITICFLLFILLESMHCTLPCLPLALWFWRTLVITAHCPWAI